MSITYAIKEVMPSRQSLDAIEERTMVRRFAVDATSGGVPAPLNGEQALEYAVGLPQLGSVYVDPIADPPEPTPLVVRRRVATQGQRSAYDVFVDVYYWDPTRQEGQCQLLSDIAFTFVDVWRSTPGPLPSDYDPGDPSWPTTATADGPALTIPTIGNVKNDNEDDIGGVPVDISGIPTSAPRIGGRVIVTEFVQGIEFTPINYISFLGKRNSGVYFDYPAGTLVYTGSRILQKRSTGQVQVEHVFGYDSQFHLFQLPQRTSGGVVVLDADKHADAVWWRQPFPNYANFIGISTCGAVTP